MSSVSNIVRNQASASGYSNLLGICISPYSCKNKQPYLTAYEGTASSQLTSRTFKGLTSPYNKQVMLLKKSLFIKPKRKKLRFKNYKKVRKTSSKKNDVDSLLNPCSNLSYNFEWTKLKLSSPFIKLR